MARSSPTGRPTGRTPPVQGPVVTAVQGLGTVDGSHKMFLRLPDATSARRLVYLGLLKSWGQYIDEELLGATGHYLPTPKWMAWLLNAEPMTDECRSWAQARAAEDMEWREQLDALVRLGTDQRGFANYIVGAWVDS